MPAHADSDSTAVGLVQMSDANGNVSWQPVTAHDLPAGTTSAAGLLQLDGTATDIQRDAAQSAGATGLADAGHVHPAGNFTPGDAGFLEWACDPAMISAGTALTTSGNVYLTRINLRTARSVSNVTAALVTLGSSLTSGQCFAPVRGRHRGLVHGRAADRHFRRPDLHLEHGRLGGREDDRAGRRAVHGPRGVRVGGAHVQRDHRARVGRAGNVTAAISNTGFAQAVGRFVAATGSTTLPGSLTVGNNALQAPTYWAAIS